MLRLPEERLLALRILRRSIDAREGVHWVYTVEAETANEDAVLRRCRDKRVSRRRATARLSAAASRSHPGLSPVIVGAGPAGLFAALGTGPGPVPVPFYWNVAAGWRNAPPM